jgi:hypothetical protein
MNEGWMDGKKIYICVGNACKKESSLHIPIMIEKFAELSPYRHCC